MNTIENIHPHHAIILATFVSILFLIDAPSHVLAVSAMAEALSSAYVQPGKTRPARTYGLKLTVAFNAAMQSLQDNYPPAMQDASIEVVWREIADETNASCESFSSTKEVSK